jgi:CHAT domain-containing protein
MSTPMRPETTSRRPLIGSGLASVSGSVFLLLLGDGSTLPLGEIRADNYDFGDVDLLAFSACGSAAVGGLNDKGREIEGLSILVQRQVAKAELLPLWPTADASAGLFMRELYRQLVEKDLNKAEALRQTQLAFLLDHPEWSRQLPTVSC